MGNIPFMILSHHRSGSNFLCNLLQVNEDIKCINEPLSMHTDVFRKLDLQTWKANDYNEECLHKDLQLYPGCIQFLKELREYIYTDEGTYVKGFKETLMFEKLEWLKCFMPTLKIIYIIRDPRAVVNSVLRNNMWEIWNYSDTIPRYLAENNYYNVNDFDKTNPVHLTTLSYKIRNNLAESNIHLFDNITIRLEDLVNNSAEWLNRVMSFIGTELSCQQTEYLKTLYKGKKGEKYSSYTTKERVLNDWEKGLDDESKKYIIQNLYEEMLRFGYL